MTLENWRSSLSRLVALLLASCAPQLAAQLPPAGPVALVGVTVIDTRTGERRPDATVITDGATIRVVGPRRATPVPLGVKVVEGRGRFVVPGLWDMHVHLTTFPVNGGRGPQALAQNGSYFLPLLVAAGVVGVRDMSGDLALLARWREEIRTGVRLGPRLVVTGRKLGGAEPVVPGAPAGTSHRAADLERSVALLGDGGADFVKVEGLDLGALGLVVAAARKRGLQVVGHLTPAVTLDEAISTGMRGIEHLHGALAACSSVEDRVVRAHRRRTGAWSRLVESVADREAAGRADLQLVMDHQDDAACARIAGRLRKEQVWLTPTLVGLAAIQGVAAEPAPQVRALLPEAITRRNVPRVAADFERRLFAAQLGVIARLDRSGAPILAGTDLPGTGRVPGLSLIDELRLMVRSGMSPLRALQATTLEPAAFLGQAPAGAVTLGAPADLLLLDRDPLLDIGNLDRPAGVLLAGRWLDRGELDRLLDDARALVASWRANAAPVTGRAAGSR